MDRHTLNALAFIVAGLFVMFTSQAASFAGEPVKDGAKVQVTGTLHAHMMAIGGETTGTTITFDKATWELDLGNNKELEKLADQLDGKKVTVTGTYHERAGVEIPKRYIVTVVTLAPAKPGAKDGVSQ